MYFYENLTNFQFGFSLIILIALLMFITFLLIVVVFTIIVGKYPAMLIGIAWIIGCIIVISLYVSNDAASRNGDVNKK